MNAPTPADRPAGPAKQGALVFIFLTVLFDVIAFGIIAPVLPKLIINFLGGSTTEASELFGLFGTIFALMQFVCSPILGIASDRFGRRPLILASNFGSAVDFAIMALAPTVGWLFLGRVISGVTTAGFAVATAYIADVTPREKRTGAFSMLWAAFGLGFIIGPALGGLLGDIDLRLPFWVAAAMALVNAFYGIFVLPESLPRERRAKRLAWERANPLGSLAFLRAHRDLTGFATIGLLSFIAQQALPSVFVLFGIYRFGWNEHTIGLTFAVVGLSQLLVSGFVVGRVVPRIGDRAAVLSGLLLGMLGFVVYAIAPNPVVFWIGIPIMSLWGLGVANQSIMSHRVAPEAQGELQGALGSVRSIGMLVAPSMFTLTFAYFIGPKTPLTLPGAPWILAAVLLGSALLLGWRITKDAAQPVHQAVPAPGVPAAPEAT